MQRRFPLDSNADDLELDAQEAQIAKLPVSLSDQYREKMGKLLDLSDEQKDRIKTWLKKQLKNWQADTADLHQRLEDDNMLVEGVVMETDFPWVGASNVHEPLTEIYMDGARAIEKRSILGAGFLWTAETDDDALSSSTASIEEMMNYNARNKWNIEREIPGVIWTANRDGLGIIQCPYVEQYEKANDILIISSEEEFLQEFPTPEDAGKTQEEYDQLREQSKSATDQQPLEIPITFEKQTYAGPKAEIVDLVDFVTIPAWVPHIQDPRCRGYGKRYNAHIETIRERAQEGAFYEDSANRLIDKKTAAKTNAYTQSKDEILGIKRTSNEDERELFELVIKGRLDDGGEIEKLLVTYSLDDDELLQVIDYVYRVDFYALFVTDERPNQLVGKSIPSKTRDFNDLADTLINQTVNANTIGTVPMFKVKKDLGDEFDTELDSSKIKPGMMLKLSDFDSVAQFIVQPTDHGENLQIEGRAMQVLDAYLGLPASLFSGGVPTGDPQAPGNKTAALISQGNLRAEDPISFLRYGIGDLGDICLSHVYQFGPAVLQFVSEQQGADGTTKKGTKTLYKKYLRKNIHMKMAGVTVIDNPDSEMAKQFQLFQMLMQTPSFAQNPKLQLEVLRDALQKGRVAGRDRYLPSDQALQQQMVDMQQQAMLQMAAQKKAQEDAQVQQNLKQKQQDLKIQDVAGKVAASNLGLDQGAAA